MPNYSVNPWQITPEMLADMQNQIVGMDYTTPPPRDINASQLTPPGAGVMPPPQIRRVAVQPSTRQPITVPMQPSARTLSDSEQLRQMLAAQQTDADEAKARANAYAGEPLQTNLKPLAALLDSWYGSKLSSGYQSPMSPDEKMMTLAKLREMASNEQAKVNQQQLQKMLGGEKNDAALLRAFLMGDRQTNSAGEKSKKDLDKMSKDFSKDVDIYAKAQGAKGMIANTNVRAEKLQRLVESYQNGDALNKNDLTDLATGMASLISGNQRNAYELVRDLRPTAAQGTINDWLQYFTSKPRGANMGPFVSRIANIVQREKELAQEQMHDIILQHIAPHRVLYETPGGTRIMKQTLKQYKVDPNIVDDVFAGDENTPGVVGGSAIGTGANLAKPAEVDQADWEKATPQEKKALSDHFRKK